MTNPPPLHAEDRPEYERLLAEALRDGTVLTALRAPGALTAAELRIRALRDADAIAAAADTEYRHYTQLRDSLRNTPPPPEGTEPTAPGLLTQLRSADGGAGLFPVLTVLTPVLAWAAALVLLVLGYTLRAADPDLTLARSLLTAGWVALAAGVVAMTVGLVGLVLTALRDGSAAPAGTDPELARELAEARRAWRTALRDRGLLPYLHASLPAVPATGARPVSNPDATGPDFTSPDFSSPGYTPPGFTGPGAEGITGPEGRESRPAAFTTPDFTGPGYTPPGFTGPDEV
ncbi:hypothetical protein F7Q99_12710 [Streptomyces kaniharaensis]|uniref:Transmembrane protein n=1 Tax=Streptomyces kaniharaensis TaxID=212423 RepID=A0A6N7KNY1_9ACTN|nr:hypothetical protein [Streptomyces kaniharaensis]MQS13121.1 hypothetical protein [Streptomyces kaniharaensis]